MANNVKKAYLLSLVMFWQSLPLNAMPGARQEAKSSEGSALPQRVQTTGNQPQTKSETPAMPDADGIYSVGNGVTPPKVIESPQPQYTDKASQKKISGTCVVELMVDAQGSPHNARIVKSITEGLPLKLKKIAAGLDQNALDAVMKYRFQPAEYRGTAVPVHLKIEITFQTY